MVGETPARNHCRICGEEVNELKGNTIKIKQDYGAKNLNSCARFRGLECASSVKKLDSFHEECRKDFVKKDRIAPGLSYMFVLLSTSF